MARLVPGDGPTRPEVTRPQPHRSTRGTEIDDVAPDLSGQRQERLPPAVDVMHAQRADDQSLEHEDGVDAHDVPEPRSALDDRRPAAGVRAHAGGEPYSGRRNPPPLT